MGQINVFPDTLILTLWIYPAILPLTPDKVVFVPDSISILSWLAISRLKIEIEAPESMRARDLVALFLFSNTIAIVG